MGLGVSKDVVRICSYKGTIPSAEKQQIYIDSGRVNCYLKHVYLHVKIKLQKLTKRLFSLVQTERRILPFYLVWESLPLKKFM